MMKNRNRFLCYYHPCKRLFFLDLSCAVTAALLGLSIEAIRNADRIVVLTEEGIAEEGTHEELLQRGKIYRRLHMSQAGA